MHVTAIIAAGGRGRRLGAQVPKQLLVLAGRPILQWSVEAFLQCDAVREVIVVVPPEVEENPPEYLRWPRVSLVIGGERRQDSVANGFDALPAGTDLVVVHDAARPLVDQGMIRRAIEGARDAGAAIVALPSPDTVKQAREGEADASGDRIVDSTLPREAIFLAQTPQAFRVDVLRDAVALGRQGVVGTDEASLAERAGHRVRLVAGSPRNIKITTPDDLIVGEALLKSDVRRDGAVADRTAPAGPTVSGRFGPRVGSGYDLHRLVEGRPLILGGITIPFERGLAGHSDADVLCHAVTDAILGAAAAGDIGQHFPDTDERWRGADSVELLRRVVSLVAGRGLRVCNVDATIVAERPKLAPYRAALASALASALGVPCEAVSVKAKTNEGVDATGRGEAIAVHAVVLLEQQPSDSRQPGASSEDEKGTPVED